MTPDFADEDVERQALLEALAYQRSSVLSIVDGLGEPLWQTSVVPSGWTVAGMVAHLAAAERHWFQQVVNGFEIELPWDTQFDDEDKVFDPMAPQLCDRPSADIVAHYRQQCQRSDEVIAVTSLSAVPKGHHRQDDPEESLTLRWVVLHLIEETAAHSGHLEIARELLDGQTRLGLR
jgi:hypothetical protein